MFGIRFDIITVIHQASITDWIQAVAALLAVFGTVFTLWKLYQRDKEKSEAVRQLGEQTRQLGEQTAQMMQQTRNLEEIGKALAGMLSRQDEQAELKRAVRRNEIRPSFQSNREDFAGPNTWNSTLANSGGTAFHIRPIKPVDVLWSVEIDEQQVQRSASLKISIFGFRDNPPAAVLFELEYRDEDGNTYRQKLDAWPGGIQSYPPELLSGTATSPHGQEDDPAA